MLLNSLVETQPGEEDAMFEDNLSMLVINQINGFYDRAFEDLRVPAIAAFLVLAGFTSLGTLRSAVVVTGGTLTLALYGVIVVAVTRPVVGFLLAVNALLVGFWSVYRVQKEMA